MRFWDSSALVGLIVAEAHTARAVQLLEEDPQVAAWWGAPVECASAVARLERAGPLSLRSATLALGRLSALAHAWHEVQPTAELRQRAVRLLRAHDLRAADALQLAAALVAAEGRPDTLTVVCFDGRLADAAEREGFRVERERPDAAGRP